MRIENFEEVKTIVAAIFKQKEILDDLKSNMINVRILKHHDTIFTIGAFDSSEHSLRNMAIDFVVQLIAHYEQSIKLLNDKLEEL